MTLRDRFWARVDTRGPDDCWEWQGARKIKGYGLVARGRRSEGLATTSRVAWELTSGPIPDGSVVRHTCDNPPCCNPTHLVLGSYSDNLRDAYTRGRR